MKPSEYAKAILGGIIALIGALVVGLDSDAAGEAVLTTQEWLTAVAAGLVTFGGVFGIPNSKPTSR